MKNLKAIVLLFILVLMGFVLLQPASGQTPPTLQSAKFYGGVGDQRGIAIDIRAGEAYMVGYSYQHSGAMFIKSALPPGSTAWDLYMLAGLDGVAASDTLVYAVGAAPPPNCGANDYVGGTEAKSALAWFDRNTGAALDCRSQNFFPYRGGESFVSVVLAGDNVYAGGSGEESGFGGWRTILAKFAADGTLLWKRKFTTDPSGNSVAGTYTRIHSSTWGMVWLNGYLYLAGHDQGAEFVGGTNAKAMLLKYDAASQPPDPDPNADGAGVLVPVWEGLSAHLDSDYRGVAALGSSLYAAGYINQSPPRNYWEPVVGDYLIDKYDESGNLLWTQTWGGAGDDRLTGVVGIGARLFAVGFTRSGGAGLADAVIFEIDPATGDRLSTTLWGDTQDDIANATATDGTDLYVLGESKSFASGEGNLAGQNDVVLLRYSILHYNFAGFFSPVDNPPVLNTAKAGSTIPVKWRLSDSAGAPVTTLDSVIALLNGATTCDAGPSDAIEEVAAATGGSALRYDAVTNQFIYNWKTEKTWKGTCRLLRVSLADGSHYDAKFKMQ